MAKADFERSSGGIVLKFQGKPARPRSARCRLLMVQVCNLKGEIVWTFPKGHLEKGETPVQAALREVQEETGWLCRIPNSRPLTVARYWFRRGERLVRKEVIWYRMSPLRKTGRRDPKEILRTCWVSLPEARRRARYPSDVKILEKLA